MALQCFSVFLRGFTFLQPFFYFFRLKNRNTSETTEYIFLKTKLMFDMNKFVKLKEGAHRLLKLAAARANVSMAELITVLVFESFDEDGQRKNNGETTGKQRGNNGKTTGK